MYLKLLVLFISAMGLNSCGAQIKKQEVKTFILAIQDGNQAFKPLVKRLIDDYNSNLGEVAIEFSDTMDSANSPVIITKGLEKRDGKVGWGQWFAQTERRGSVVPVPGIKTTETTKYTMRVEFDEDFLKDHEADESPGVLNTELRKLFAHEIGHGFQLDHVPEANDVMYYDISGDKDFTPYWPRIRAFFSGE